jgi:MarC family membrane protein
MNTESWLAVLMSLIVITDPFGNIPYFLAALKHIPQERRIHIIARECFIAFAVLLFFLFFGSIFLKIFGLKEESLRIAGGVILFLIALRMIFPSENNSLFHGMHGQEPFIVPIAVPLIAGPSAMAAVILLSHQSPEQTWSWVAAIAIAIAVTSLVFWSAQTLHKILGEQTITAIERLMGMILAAMAIQMLLEGFHDYILLMAKKTAQTINI